MQFLNVCEGFKCVVCMYDSALWCVCCGKAVRELECVVLCSMRVCMHVCSFVYLVHVVRVVWLRRQSYDGVCREQDDLIATGSNWPDSKKISK